IGPSQRPLPLPSFVHVVSQLFCDGLLARAAPQVPAPAAMHGASSKQPICELPEHTLQWHGPLSHCGPAGRAAVSDELPLLNVRSSSRPEPEMFAPGDGGQSKLTGPNRGCVASTVQAWPSRRPPSQTPASQVGHGWVWLMPVCTSARVDVPTLY